MDRVLPSLICIVAACLFAGGAQALGLGAVHPPPVLGQALDLGLPIRLGDGESLDASCVDADVQMGASRVPADQIAVDLRPGPRPGEVLARVRSAVATAEPVVVLSVAVGCPARVTRRYTLLTELPETAAATAALAAMPAPATAGADAPAVTRAADLADAAASIAPRAAASPPPRGDGLSAAKAPRLPSPPPRDVRRQAPAPAQPSTGHGLPVTPLSTDAARLADEPTTIAADVAASMASPSSTSTEATFPPSPMQTPADRAAPWSPGDGGSDGVSAGWRLLAALTAIGGAAGALAWRRRMPARARPPAPTPSRVTATPSIPHPDPRAPAAAATSAAHSPGVAAPGSVAATSISRSGGRVVDAAAAPARPTVAPPLVGADASLPVPDLSLDERIDLEQQIEFFAALGRDDAAVDLLQDHLRRAGGRLPIASLKLLEIQRRLGDRGGYEATARHFGEGFGVAVPAWDAAAPPRGLDGDPVRAAALQRRWPCPPEAIAWLDALLHGRDDGGDRVGLAAYDDALLLYRIARDLHDHGADAPAGAGGLRPDDRPSLCDASHAAPPAARRYAGTPPPDLGAALHLDLDFDRIATETEREALVVH